MVGCPQCGTPIQPTWDWCEACGFDPESMKPAGWRPAVAPHERPATAPRPAAPPPDWHAPPPGAQPAGHTTAGNYQPGGFAPPPFAPPPGAYPPGMYGSPPPQGSSSAGTVLKVLLGVGVAFVLFIFVCIAAVTLLGKNASSKFSRIDTAIGAPSGPATATTAAVAVWQPWTSPDGKYAVEFPGTPRLLPPSLNTKASSESEAQVQVGNAFYDVGSIEFKPEYYYPNDETGLRTGLEAGLASFKLTITSTKMGEFAGVKYLDAAVAGAQNGKQLAGTARVFVVGQRVYFAIAFSSDGSEDFQRFADSLHQL